MIIKLKLLPHVYICWQHWKASCRNSTLKEPHNTLIAIHHPVPRKVLHINPQQSLDLSQPQAKSTCAGGEGKHKQIRREISGCMYVYGCFQNSLRRPMMRFEAGGSRAVTGMLKCSKKGTRGHLQINTWLFTFFQCDYWVQLRSQHLQKWGNRMSGAQLRIAGNSATQF